MRTLLLLPLLAGCIAIKPTVHMAQSDEAFYDAEAAAAQDRAVYEYTLAEQYRLKAREEWGSSNYGAADGLAQKARGYAREAEQLARHEEDDLDALDNAEDFVPEQVQRPSTSQGQ